MQSTLFLEEDLPRYAADTTAVRERLEEMLAKMQAAASWPWKASTVESYRERLWPSLLARLSDPDEAAKLRAAFEAEIARLGAA